MLEVIDFITPPASPQELVARGVTGVLVYIAPDAWHWSKVASGAWIQAAIAAGLQVGLLFETSVHQMEGGFAAGIAHGKAVNQALNDRHLPLTVPVTFADDENVQPSGFQVRSDYYMGVASVCNVVRGYYGEGAVIEYLAGRGLINHGFQSESTSFLGNAAPTPHTDVRQVYGKTIPGLGGSYDVDDVYHLDWGQLNVPPTANTTTTTEEDMLYYDDVNPGLDGTHPRCMAWQADGSILLGNGAALLEAKGVPYNNLQVVPSPLPGGAGWLFRGSAPIRDGSGRCIGARGEATSPDGQWHPYTFHFAAA